MLTSTLCLVVWLGLAMPTSGTGAFSLELECPAGPQLLPASYRTGNLSSAGRWGTDSILLEPTGSYPFSTGTAVELDTVRKLAYVGAGGGVMIVDVSDPTRPNVLSTRIRGSMRARDLAWRGNYLYVAAFSYNDFHQSQQDVQVWNVADPVNPVHVTDIDMYYPASALDIRDTVLAVSTFNQFALYNIANGIPERIIDTLMGGYFVDVQMQDSFLFAAMFWGCIEAWSIADVRHPRLLGQWGATENEPRIKVCGNRLYLTYLHMYQPQYMGGVWVYDISDPTQGQLVGVYDTVGFWIPWNTCLHDTFAVVSSWDDLRVLSVADPANVRLLGSTGDGCLGFSWQDTLGYAAFMDRFAVVNLKNPALPVEVGSVPLNRIGSFVPDRGLIYSVTDRLWILDQVHFPEIETVGTLDVGPHPSGIIVQDTIAVVPSWDTARFAVLSLSDPQHPAVLVVETLAGHGLGVALSDSLCYATNGNALLVYSLAQPANPMLIGALNAPLGGMLKKNQDSLLFAGGVRLQVVNVSNPALPLLVLDTAIRADDLAVRDTFLYLVAGDSGKLQSFSTADPRRLRLLSEVGRNVGSDLTLFDTLLVTAFSDGYSGRIQAFALGNPGSPREVGAYRTDFCPYQPLLRHDTLYVRYSIGLYRYRLGIVANGIGLEPPSTGRAEPFRVWPSPVRRALHLSGAPGAVLLDVAGRKVARLKPGLNDLRRLAPGVYFASSEEQRRTIKIVLQR